jgi:ABC-type lipoprotein export system ATPase subunit
MHRVDFLRMKIGALVATYPYLESFFVENGLEITSENREEPISAVLSGDDLECLVDKALVHIETMNAFLGTQGEKITSLTILAGQDKDGQPEQFGEFTVMAGEVISIVGPTGSGKSRLLADIEWVAQADTPTNRRILLNGEQPNKKWRFSIEDKLVAQLSQNMNFIMDLSVYEFVDMHARSRMVLDREQVIERIIQQANDLAGEKFKASTPVTSLSGGQSRALMIADTAILSKSPVVLIDEIENAGIDRQKALSLLVAEDKIVLIATHDPMLALLAEKRIVIKNGGIASVITSSIDEQKNLAELQALDDKMREVRNRLRQGELIETI